MGFSRIAQARLIKRISCTAFILCCSALLVASKAPTALERVQAEGKLQVISRNGPTTYYEGANGQTTGFEYSLAKNFADELGVELEIIEEDNLSTMLDKVGTPAGQIAASGLTVTPSRSEQVRFTEPYLSITQQLIYHSKQKKPESIADLIGKDILVIANSAHSERLQEIQKEYPELRWREQTDVEMSDLMEMVHKNEVDYAVVDSNAFSINRTFYHRVRAAFDIAESQQLAWAFPQERDSSLYDAAQAYFARIKNNGTLDDIKEHYYGHVDEITNSGALLFARRIEQRLPRWQELLKTAGETYQLDWRLLAAVSYQESHWNSKAKSYTGVRGLMMLTNTTAKEMGVSNRIDPEQSINGGAKYLKKIYDRLPEDITDAADRTWLALAAYNIGYSHLKDARELTEKGGDNPNKWADVREYLPLLAKRKYYRQVSHGYARGWEAVDYVQHIRHFHNILAWHNQLKQRNLLAAEDKLDYPSIENNQPRDINLSVSL